MYVCVSFVFSVGKTSLITRFMYDSFDNTYQVSPKCEKYKHFKLFARVVL